MAKKINFHVNEFILPAVLIDYKETPINPFNDCYSKIALVYYQNRIVKKVTDITISPEGGIIHSSETIKVLVDYCVIPEFDEFLK